MHLNDLTGLKSVYLGGTKISDGGLSYLKKTILGLRILDRTNGETNRPVHPPAVRLHSEYC